MWNKRDDEVPAPRPVAAATPPAPMPAPVEPVAGAAIGPSRSIGGELTGDEDLTIHGRVEGTVNLPKHSVTIGRTARVSADIRAKAVSVEGEVKGNLLASEQILIRKTATMLGNLSAPRVGLEDGCRFKGSVDMESASAARSAAEGSTRPGDGPRAVSTAGSIAAAKPLPLAVSRP